MTIIISVSCGVINTKIIWTTLYDNQWNSSDELRGEIAKQSDFYLLNEGEQLTVYAISLMPNDNAN